MRRYLAVVVLVVMTLTGCSSPMGSSEEPTEAPIVVDVGTDIASGCWDASQRTLPLSETEGGVEVQQWSTAPALQIDPAKSYTATVETSKGTFVIELFPAEAPIAVNSFVCLARASFYDGVGFHRIISNFVIQGGDPTGTGGGGPGYRFEDEPVTREYDRGIVAMANAGPDTNGSQFFVCLVDGRLAPNYTIFGRVISGLETIDAIAAVETRAIPPSTDLSSPVEPVTMTSVTISES